MSNGLKQQLGLGDGIVFAFGSVAGAGILFLPSLVYSIAGRDSLIVWLGAVCLAYPLLVIMSDMVKRVSDGSGLEGFISLGLGEFAAASVPWLLLTILFCGGSGSAYVAGKFVDIAFGGGSKIAFITAFIVATIATVVPASGLTLGRRTQQVITWGTIGLAVTVLALTLPEARTRSFDAVTPEFRALQPILLGVVAAFFAFVGLENLTFIAGEFKRPDRDFYPAALIAFALYTVLLLGLSLTFGLLAPSGAFDPTAGLIGLAKSIGDNVAKVTALFAVFVVMLNLTSWVWGMSRMIFKASEQGKLPRFFAKMADDGVPRRAVLFAGGLELVGLVPLVIHPAWGVEFLVIVGAVGCILYLLALASYIRIGTRVVWRMVSVLLAVVIIVNLIGVGWPILVPVTVAAASYVMAAIRDRSKHSAT